MSKLYIFPERVLPLLFTLLVFSQCSKPQYPACDSDADCKEKGEVCIDKRCQECAKDDQCVRKLGPGATCRANRCEPKPECLRDTDCGNGKCQNNKCVTGACTTDKDCGAHQECFAGTCRDKSGQLSANCRDPRHPSQVALKPAHFDYDSSEIRADVQKTLDEDAECLKQAADQNFTVEGHCDERGTVEYNLSLGEQRSNSVIKYLQRDGVNSDRLRTVSKGKSEPLCTAQSETCWGKNRRVEFKQP